MILKKPYAFFIKYFRIINLTMAVLMMFLIYRTWIIGNFFNGYIADYAVASNGFVLGEYINLYNYLCALLIIILTIVVIAVTIVKEKPSKLYAFNLILYIGVIVLYGICYSILNGINEALIDVSVSRTIRDITFIILFIQIISFVITIMRTAGFDIKKFDFVTDLHELEIDVKDSEEFEVAVELDKNKLMRDFRKNYRNFKYVYIENKFIINIALIIFVIIGAFIFYLTKGVYVSEYSQGKNFQANGIVANVTNTYLTQTDKKGNIITTDNDNKISKDRTLVVVKFNIRKTNNQKKYLNTGTITLRIGDNSYAHTTKYNDDLTDIGVGYADQELSTEFTSYILVFNIPKILEDKKLKLKMNDQLSYVRGELGAKNIYVKLRPYDLTDKKTTQEFKLGDNVKLDGSLLEQSTFKINQFSIGNKFKFYYNFCSTKNKCSSSYEYITPTATGNYPKTLLRIEGEFNLDSNLNLNKMNNIYYFLNSFGTIYYKIDDTWYSKKINSNLIKPKKGQEKGITYIEIPKDVEKSPAVYLIINIRNFSYKYTLK